MKNLSSFIILIMMASSLSSLRGQTSEKVEAPIAQSVIIADKGTKNVIGYFEEITNDIWESSINGQKTKYAESGRDQWTILLTALESDQVVALNLWTEKVMFNGTEKYSVIESRSDAVPDKYMSKETVAEPGVISNVALGKPAKQSSDYSAGPGKNFPAGLAVDGVKSGFGKLSHTLQDYGAWWEVDLGQSYKISSIKIYNATDHPQRMNDFTILVSETAFTGNNGGTVFAANQPAPSTTQTYTGNAQGRYVRIFLNETNYLTIHEVEVYGSIGSAAPVNVPLENTATTSTNPTINTTTNNPPVSTTTTNVPTTTNTPTTASVPTTTNVPTTNTTITNTSPTSSRDAINNYIRNELNYNTSELLAVVENNKSESLPSNRDQVGNGVIICTFERREAEETLQNISLVNPSNTIFPGALVYGDRSLAEGKPRSIGIERAPITLTLMLPGAYGESGSKQIDTPKLSSTQGARNELIENWFNKNPGETDYKNFAKQTLTTSRVYNSDQASLELGFDAKWAQGNADVKAAMDINTEKEVTVAIFKQVFYTVACDKPTTPADFFAPSVSLAQVKNIMTSKEPPAYVKSVDYGRMLMIRMETDKLAASANLEAAFNYAAGPDSKIGGSIDAKYKKVLENSTFRLYALGGNAQTPAGIIDGTDLNKLRSIIYDDALFRRDNPGAPLSYTVNYLQGDVTASVYASTDYVEKICTEYTNGQIILKHGGGYVGRFIVTWEIDGKQCPECIFESGKIANGYKKTLPIPADAKNLKVQGQYGGIGTNNWKEVIYQVETGPTNCTYLIRGSAVVRFGQKIDPSGKVIKEYR